MDKIPKFVSENKCMGDDCEYSKRSEEEINKLEEEIEIANGLVERLNAELEDLKEQLAATSEELDEAESRKEYVMSEHEAMSGEIADLKNEVEFLSEEWNKTQHNFQILDKASYRLVVALHVVNRFISVEHKHFAELFMNVALKTDIASLIADTLKILGDIGEDTEGYRLPTFDEKEIE